MAFREQTIFVFLFFKNLDFRYEALIEDPQLLYSGSVDVELCTVESNLIS